MQTHRFDLGTLAFRLETEEPINAGSSQAKRLGNALVKDINKRLFDAVADGVVPGYHVVVVLDDIRQGSLLYYLSVYADVILGGSTASIALGKFVKDYPSLRAGVLAITIDINTVSSKLFKFARRQYPLKLFVEKLHSEAQIKLEAQIIEAKLVAAEIEERAAAEIRERAAAEIRERAAAEIKERATAAQKKGVPRRSPSSAA